MPRPVTWRALLALYRHSRAGSALYELARRKKLGDQAAWSTESYLLASVIDELRGLTYLYSAVHRGTDAPLPAPPQPFPRPGTVAAGAPAAAAASSAAAPQGEGKTHIGYGAIPAADFEHWWTTGEEAA